MLAIDADATNVCGKVDDQGRIGMIGIQAGHRFLLAQVVIRTPRNDDVSGRFGPQFRHHMAPEEAGATGHDHDLFPPETRAH